jgi:hypothetical protein
MAFVITGIRGERDTVSILGIGLTVATSFLAGVGVGFYMLIIVIGRLLVDPP